MAEKRQLSPGRRSRRRERGQSLVEFALVLPIFLIITLAAIDFGWALRAYVISTNAAREGARVGVVGSSSDAIKTAVVDRSAGLLTTSNVSVTNAKGASGTNVTVGVTYSYNYITPLGSLVSTFTGGSLPSPLAIQATAVMRLE